MKILVWFVFIVIAVFFHFKYIKNKKSITEIEKEAGSKNEIKK